MAVLTTGQSFADGDQVTAQKLEDIASQATFRTGANNTADALTIEVDSSGGYLKVPSGGISSNELKSDASVDANRAVTTNHIRDNAVTFEKMTQIANLKAIGNVSGSTANPGEVSILDDDTFATASDTTLATSDSIKNYLVSYVSSYGINKYVAAWSQTHGGTAVADGASLTITHNLGTTDVSVSAYVNSSASDTGALDLTGLGNNMGAVVIGLTSNTVILKLMANGYASISSGGIGSATSLTNQYVKVVVMG